MEKLKINCPFGHGEMQNGTTVKEIDIRGEKISYQLECVICSVCELTRSTVEQTAKAQILIADMYRKKVGLLSGEEIKKHRERLGLSQQQLADKALCSKMSIIRWENGVIQKEASDKALRSVLCPIDRLDEFSGNRQLSLERIRLVLEEFEKNSTYQLLIPGDRGLYATKNCWYADLVAYRELGKSMTGATYSIMPLGPQLDNYADLVNVIYEMDPVKVEPLSGDEISIIKQLSEIFKRQTDAHDAALNEPEWQGISNDLGRRISYQTAFKLVAA